MLCSVQGPFFLAPSPSRPNGGGGGGGRGGALSVRGTLPSIAVVHPSRFSDKGGGGRRRYTARRTHTRLSLPRGSSWQAPTLALARQATATGGGRTATSERTEARDEKRRGGRTNSGCPWCRTRRTPRRRRSWCSLPVSYPSFRVLASQQRHSPLAQRTPRQRSGEEGGERKVRKWKQWGLWRVRVVEVAPEEEKEEEEESAKEGEGEAPKRSGKRLQQILSSLHP